MHGEMCLESWENLSLCGMAWVRSGTVQRQVLQLAAGAGRANGAVVAAVRLLPISCSACYEASGGVILCNKKLSKSANHLLVISMQRKFCHTSFSSSYRKSFFCFFWVSVSCFLSINTSRCRVPCQAVRKSCCCRTFPGPVAVLLLRFFRSRKLHLWS